MTDYLVWYCNSQKVNESCNGSLISRGVQEHGMKILYPLHVTGFYTLTNDYKKDMDILGEDILCTIIYLENSYKARFSYLNNIIGNDYVLKSRNIQGLLLRYRAYF